MTTYDERITTEGARPILRVPVERSTDPTPAREGWKPFWVNVNLDRTPQKLVYYKREAVA